MSELDYTPFNKWQIANCASCSVPDPCKKRESYHEEFRKGELNTRRNCPGLVPL